MHLCGKLSSNLAGVAFVTVLTLNFLDEISSVVRFEFVFRVEMSLTIVLVRFWVERFVYTCEMSVVNNAKHYSTKIVQ